MLILITEDGLKRLYCKERIFAKFTAKSQAWNINKIYLNKMQIKITGNENKTKTNVKNIIFILAIKKC